MNILNPFATFNLAALPAKHHSTILLDAGAQCFVITAPHQTAKTAETIVSLKKTDRVRFGLTVLLEPGTPVTMVAGPYAHREGILIGLPCDGSGNVGEQYWIRLIEAGGLSEPFSAPGTWFSTEDRPAETRRQGRAHDLRAQSTKGRHDPHGLEDAARRAVLSAQPEDILVLGLEIYRRRVEQLLENSGRTDLHIAVAPHSFKLPVLITDGRSLGQSGDFMGYADSRGTAIINVKGSCTQTIPAGSYYLVNEFGLVNCPDDELLAALSGPRPYEFSFDCCAGCHAQGYRLVAGATWRCPLCGKDNRSERHGSWKQDDETVSFGPQPEQFETVEAMIERHENAMPPGAKIIRVAQVRDLRDSARGPLYSIGMFTTLAADYSVSYNPVEMGRDAPDQCVLIVNQGGATFTPSQGERGTWVLSNISHTREETFDLLLNQLGAKNVAAIKAGNWPPTTTGDEPSAQNNDQTSHHPRPE
jgi:hypothetical protein